MRLPPLIQSVKRTIPIPLAFSALRTNSMERRLLEQSTTSSTNETSPTSAAASKTCCPSTQIRRHSRILSEPARVLLLTVSFLCPEQLSLRAHMGVLFRSSRLPNSRPLTCRKSRARNSKLGEEAQRRSNNRQGSKTSRQNKSLRRQTCCAIPSDPVGRSSRYTRSRKEG